MHARRRRRKRKRKEEEQTSTCEVAYLEELRWMVGVPGNQTGIFVREEIYYSLSQENDSIPVSPPISAAGAREHGKGLVSCVTDPLDFRARKACLRPKP